MFNEGGDEGLDPIPNAGGTSRMTDMDRVKLVVLLRLGARMNGFSTDLWTLRRMRDPPVSEELSPPDRARCCAGLSSAPSSLWAEEAMM